MTNPFEHFSEVQQNVLFNALDEYLSILQGDRESEFSQFKVEVEDLIGQVDYDKLLEAGKDLRALLAEARADIHFAPPAKFKVGDYVFKLESGAHTVMRVKTVLATKYIMEVATFFHFGCNFKEWKSKKYTREYIDKNYKLLNEKRSALYKTIREGDSSAKLFR